MGRNGTQIGLNRTNWTEDRRGGRRMDGEFDEIMGKAFKGCRDGKDYKVSKVGKVGKVFKEEIGNGWEE